MQSENYVTVGSGDDYIQDWSNGFEQIMDSITQKLIESELYDLPIDWESVLQGMTEFEYLPIQYSTDVHEFFDCLPGGWVEKEGWDANSPGRSGTWIKVSVEKSKLQMALELMREVEQRLEKYWLQNGYEQKAAVEERKLRKTDELDDGDLW